MCALRLWCLIALLAIVGCQSDMELSGNGNEDGDLTDDEDIDDEDFTWASGSGAGQPQNATSARAPTTVVETTTQRVTTTARVIINTSMKTVRATQPPVRITTMLQTTTINAPLGESDEDEDESEDNENPDVEEENDSETDQPAVSPSVEPKFDDERTVTSVDSTVTGGRDLLEFIWKQPGIVAGLIGGAILGVLFAILLTLFIIYRLRRRADRGAYRRGGSRGSQDDTGAFWFDDEEAGAIAVSRASAERYPSQAQGANAAYMNPQAGGTLKGSQMLTMPSGMNVQSQPLLYASLAPNAQTAYDEYLANLYNQQLYNGYIQQKA